MMMVVSVMVVSVSALIVMDSAILFVTMFTGSFEFKRCVGNAMLRELFANGFFDVVRISLGNYMKSCVITLPIHTPNVNVVNIQNAIASRVVHNKEDCDPEQNLDTVNAL